MKTIKLAWKIFKFMTFILPMMSFILEIVAIKLEAKNSVHHVNNDKKNI